jgi:hypothetical protein
MRRLTLTLFAPLVAGALALGPAVPGFGDSPGPDGAKLTLQTDAQFTGYDVAIDSGGTAYVGWISSTAAQLRMVHLCVLPQGAKACLGGVKTIDSLGPSSAMGLQVVTGHTDQGATLVWFHDTDASVSSPIGGMLATAVATPDGSLAPAIEWGSAPSFGSLKTAMISPAGQLWAVVQSASAAPEQLWVYTDYATPTPVTAPFFVNQARLAFDGSTAVLAVDWYGQISKPVAYSVLAPGSSWSAFRNIAHTWNVGAFGMAAAHSGIRVVASTDNASYRPVIAKFDGDSFGPGKLTGEKKPCPTSSHNLVADGSGRLADVGNACGDLRLSNLPGTTRAAWTEFSAGGTVAGGDPQVATTTRGTGWVVWGIQSALGNKLLVVPILLPALQTVESTSTAVGKVWLTGPATCLPPVTTKVELRADGKNGWKVANKTLELGNKVIDNGKIDGGQLKAGKAYVLSGTVRFTRPGNQDKLVTVEHGFRSCDSD